MQDWPVILGEKCSVATHKGLMEEELAFEAEIDFTYMGRQSRGN